MCPYDPRISAEINMHKIQQTIKWTVYALLIVNFVFYVFEDWNRAMHTLNAGSTVLKWTGEFATTIDELGWFLLLFMFEIETYIVDDEDWTGWIGGFAAIEMNVSQWRDELLGHKDNTNTIDGDPASQNAAS